MGFDTNKWLKNQLLKEAGLLNEVSELSLAIGAVIPENTSYSDFAKAVAKILREDYGTHNYNNFMEVLHAELGMEESINEEKSYDTYTVNITTSDPKEGGPDEDFTEKVKVDSSLTGDDIKASIKDTLYDMGYNRLYKLNYEKA